MGTTNVRVAVADTCSSTSAPVSGCTDPTATNYDPTATVDDGSCVIHFSHKLIYLLLGMTHYRLYGTCFGGNNSTLVSDPLLGNILRTEEKTASAQLGLEQHLEIHH